ncbi:MAG: hypothetical protein JWP57_1641, partial [Spirosoma sp.]|nr:hypothetical protein [Spirosoma sp.]
TAMLKYKVKFSEVKLDSLVLVAISTMGFNALFNDVSGVVGWLAAI